MNEIVSYASAIPLLGSRSDDDFSARLNHRYTVAVLVIFAIITGGQKLVGSDPIKCWVPAHFSDNHEEYTQTYCWIRNTYWLPFAEHIPHEDQEDRMHFIQYYQWVPFILVFQASLFYLPIMMWRHMNRRSGMDVDEIVEMAQTFIIKEDEEQEKLEEITSHFARYLDRKKEHTSCTVSLKSCFTRTCCFCCASRGGSYIVSLYLFIKFLFVVNVVGQLFLLNLMLGSDFNVYGFEVLGHILQDTDWTASQRFPRITFCDLKVRRLGNVQRYTVQCVLPINLFNEMIFLFIWFWLVFVAVITVYSFLAWTIREISTKERVRFVRKHLKEKPTTEQEKREFAEFVERFLKHDGVFVLRLIAENANDLVLGEVLENLWSNYRREMRYRAKETELEETGEGTLA